MSLKTQSRLLGVLGILLLASGAPALAQVTETVGSRALGMGGAFVAVANDSTATWWNPGALPAGPFVDATFGRSLTEAGDVLPARRERTMGLAVLTPPLGLSYYRFHVTDIQAPNPTGSASAIRQEGRGGVPTRSLAASQFGITLVQTIAPGVHAGATLKYLRGTVRTGQGDGLRSAGDLLDEADGLVGGDTHGVLDVDVGLLAVAGGIRLGVLVRHLREPTFVAGGETMRLPRQARIGAAFDGEAVGRAPYIVSLDADVTRVTTATGGRRNVAFGVERWMWDKRVGVRGGGRVSTVGRRDGTATAGVSIAPRAGLFLEAYAAGGGSADDRGWGLGTRVSF